MNSVRPSIIDLPFHERRYIAVVTDQEFDNKSKQIEQGNVSDSIWPMLGLVGSAIVPGGFLVRAGILAASLAAASRSGSIKPDEAASNVTNEEKPGTAKRSIKRVLSV